jgi:site-specific DNA-methyltransferase (adenine-specific)
MNNMKIDLRLGDCLEVLKTIPDNSIDAVITDPPYGIGFMNKEWDNPQKHQELIERERERSVKRFEEGKSPAKAGFSTGVQPGLPIGGAKEGKWFQDWCELWARECFRILKPGGHALSFSAPRTYHRMATAFEDSGFQIRDQIMWVFGSGFPKSHNIGKAIDKIEGNEREVIGDSKRHGGGTSAMFPYEVNNQITKGNSEWEGWGTALKPAHEPIVMARKPLSEKSIAENVLKHGTGGINIDGSRIGFTDGGWGERKNEKDELKHGDYGHKKINQEQNEQGRFPANIIFDEEAGQLLDEQSGISKSQGGNSTNIGGFVASNSDQTKIGVKCGFGDKGGASRFFYCPKAAKKDRNEGLDGMIEIFTPTIKLVYLLKNNIWEKEGLKTIPADTDKSHQKVIDESIIMEDNKWNIESFGNYIMEQLVKDNKSITETEINSTTIYQTLNSWIQNHTRIYIAELFGEMVSDIKFVSDVEQKSTTLNITLQNKDGYSQSVKNVELKGLWSINIVPSKSSHPTVKPTDLMRYLINLITPPNGTILDPFMGSGSTGKAAVRCGVNFIGIEKEQEYMDIASARIEHEKNKPVQQKLFNGKE